MLFSKHPNLLISSTFSWNLPYLTIPIFIFIIHLVILEGCAASEEMTQASLQPLGKAH